MDIQIAFRSSGREVHGSKVYMAIGLLRAREGAFDAERLSYFRVRSEGNVFRELGSSGLVADLDTDRGLPLLYSVGDLVTLNAWRLPFWDGLVAYLRKTRVDAALPRHEVFSFSGFLHVDPRLPVDEDVVHAFSGPSVAFCRPDLSRRPESGLVEATRGSTLNQFLHLPIWGFGEEPVGLRSTLELGVADLSDRHRRLTLQEGLSEVDQAELEAVTDALRPYGLPGGQTDDDYQLVLRRLAEDRPEIAFRPSADPATKAELEDIGSAMAEAVRAVMPRPAF